jgi:hypothetical protein
MHVLDKAENKTEPKKFGPEPTSGIAEEAKWNCKLNG